MPTERRGRRQARRMPSLARHFGFSSPGLAFHGESFDPESRAFAAAPIELRPGVQAGEISLGLDPGVDLGFEQAQRQGAVHQHLGMELAHIEIIAKRGLRASAQFPDLEFADLVG